MSTSPVRAYGPGDFVPYTFYGAGKVEDRRAPAGRRCLNTDCDHELGRWNPNDFCWSCIEAGHAPDETRIELGPGEGVIRGSDGRSGTTFSLRCIGCGELRGIGVRSLKCGKRSSRALMLEYKRRHPRCRRCGARAKVHPAIRNGG